MHTEDFHGPDHSFSLWHSILFGEELCEALDLRPGSKVLDVAAGNGNATLAAARRWCEVTSTDYLPALLERGRERAAAERLAIDFRQVDAEALPFPDASFDVAVSTFGVMFTADQDNAAAEARRDIGSMCSRRATDRCSRRSRHSTQTRRRR